MKYIILEEVDSTNSYVSLHAGELDDMTMVVAHSQTAGRGQLRSKSSSLTVGAKKSMYDLVSGSLSIRSR